ELVDPEIRRNPRRRGVRVPIRAPWPGAGGGSLDRYEPDLLRSGTPGGGIRSRSGRGPLRRAGGAGFRRTTARHVPFRQLRATGGPDRRRCGANSHGLRPAKVMADRGPQDLLLLAGCQYGHGRGVRWTSSSPSRATWPYSGNGTGSRSAIGSAASWSPSIALRRSWLRSSG